MKVLEIEFLREAECAAEVAIWNYWDLEHPEFVHEGMHPKHVLHESSDFCIGIDTVRLPYLPFLRTSSLFVMTRQDKETCINYSTFFGILTIQTQRITEPREDSCVTHYRFQFYLEGWKRILTPLIKRFVPFWNERGWNEDLAMKLRRQKVLRWGFQDFKGLPDEIAKRVYDGPITTKLPIPRLKGSPVDALFKHTNDPAD